MTLQFNFLDAERKQQTVLEGFRYRPALIGRTDEDALVARVRELPFREFEFHGYLGKRRVVCELMHSVIQSLFEMSWQSRATKGTKSTSCKS